MGTSSIVAVILVPNREILSVLLSVSASCNIPTLSASGLADYISALVDAGIIFSNRPSLAGVTCLPAVHVHIYLS